MAYEAKSPDGARVLKIADTLTRNGFAEIAAEVMALSEERSHLIKEGYVLKEAIRHAWESIENWKDES